MKKTINTDAIKYKHKKESRSTAQNISEYQKKKGLRDMNRCNDIV